MTELATTPTETAAAAKPGAGPWLAALAIVPILGTVYQTMVLTDVTGDVIRKGLDGDRYSMIWTSVCWTITMLYGMFAGLWATPRYGSRDTLRFALVVFAMGNLLCGAATDVATMSAAKLVEGIGKGMVIVTCRSLLYRQFDRMMIVAVGIYGVLAYGTRPSTPVVMALIYEALSWRWIFWVNVPLALLALALAHCFIPPDRPDRPTPLRVDWVAVTLFVGWIVSLIFAFGWYRKWGGWTSDAFTAVASLGLLLPPAAVMWVGLGPREHLRRMFRIRLYVLAMSTRMLFLMQLAVVMAVMANYLIGLRGYPRPTAGWILAAATPTMAASTALTTWFHRRSLRHVWQWISVLGGAACLWWLSSLDNFTAKGQIALMLGCWGAFAGLLPPAFLQDEVEGLDPGDKLYGAAVGNAVLISALMVIPSLTSTIISAWTDRALDVERMNLRENRPAVEESSARLTDYYQRHGMEPADASRLASTAMGDFARAEAAAHGVRRGLRLLSGLVAAIGLLITGLLMKSERPIE